MVVKVTRKCRTEDITWRLLTCCLCRAQALTGVLAWCLGSAWAVRVAHVVPVSRASPPGKPPAVAEELWAAGTEGHRLFLQTVWVNVKVQKTWESRFLSFALSKGIFPQSAQIHRRILWKEGTNHWLPEPPALPVGAEQAEWTLPSMTELSACVWPWKSVGFGVKMSCRSFTTCLTFSQLFKFFNSRFFTYKMRMAETFTYLIWSSWRHNEIMFLSFRKYFLNASKFYYDRFASTSAYTSRKLSTPFYSCGQ